MNKEELKKKLNPKFVSKRKQGYTELSYIEGWHAINEANRIFDFDGWSRETIHTTCLHTPQTKDEKYYVTYSAKVRITVGDVVREGTGHGQGINKNLGLAHEGAEKEAETDAMKRALMTFGYPFGLALYDKQQKNVGIDPPTPEEEARKWLDKQKPLIESCNTEDALVALNNANGKFLENLMKYPSLHEEYDNLYMSRLNAVAK